jgi:large subunit ribosomal protein L35
MPKMKSVSGAKKRFRATGKGNFKHNHCCKSHILTKKTTKRKRKLRQGAVVDHANAHSVARMLPYA